MVKNSRGWLRNVSKTASEIRTPAERTSFFFGILNGTKNPTSQQPIDYSTQFKLESDKLRYLYADCLQMSAAVHQLSTCDETPDETSIKKPSTKLGKCFPIQLCQNPLPPYQTNGLKQCKLVSTCTAYDTTTNDTLGFSRSYRAAKDCCEAFFLLRRSASTSRRNSPFGSFNNSAGVPYSTTCPAPKTAILS